MKECPFKAGDYVIYKPSQRGYDLIDGERPEMGRKYRVFEIERDNYVVLEEYKHPGGGIYWTEFEKADE
jgi:hypothetical protein